MNTHSHPSLTISSLPLLLLTSIILLLHHHPTTATTTTPFDFIRSSCNATLYPNLCYTSLSRYADAVQTNPAQLAEVAVGISLSKARQMAAYVNNLVRGRHSENEIADPRAVSALHDCRSTFEDAIDGMRDSLKQLHHLGNSSSTGTGNYEELKFMINNVQTWMSSAMTNEETCSDGFEGVKDEPMKSDVCGKVTKVTMFTSNALALVHAYAASLSS